MYKNILFGVLLFLFAVSPAYAVVGNGSFGDWLITDSTSLNPKIGNTNPAFWTANCTDIFLYCGYGGGSYGFCKHWTTCAGVIPISLADVPVPLKWGDGYVVGLFIGNTATGEQVYTGSTGEVFTLDPAPYKMSGNIQASASGLLGSMVGQLFRVIIIGVGIVGGVIVTLFGLRWLIRFVRGNLHG